MTSVVYLIERIAPGIWLICAAALLFWLRRLLLARRAIAIAEFDLERELAEANQARAVTWSVLIIELALAAAAVAMVIAPTLRNDLLSGLLNEPEAGAPVGGGGPDKFITSTPGGEGQDSFGATLTAQSAAGGGGVVLLLTAVASPTPVGTIIAGYPTPADCNTATAWLEVPAPGQVLFDSVEVIGIATIPDFAFYKLELAGPSTGGSFAPLLGEKTSPVTEKGTLGLLPLSPFQPGDYTFRLAVFDITGSLRASCSVRVNIIAPPPSATPPGGSAP